MAPRRDRPIPRAGSRRRRLAGVVAAMAATAIVLAGCGGGSSGSGTPDGGATLTMWARSAIDVFSKRLVDEYNKTHKNKVKLTIIPSDSYQQKVGAAAGSNSLPDILAADVVYAPNYVKQGLFRDITADIKKLSFYDNLAKAHIEAASRDGKMYGVPNKVDSSLFLYNKDLYKKAGLDPEQGPKTFQDVYEHAKAIRALGANTYGFYFPGNCSGCNAYTMFPYAVAAGHPPFADDGHKADFDNGAFGETLRLYRKMVEEKIAPSGVKTDDGANWTASFLAGKVGILPAGSFLFGDLTSKAKFDWGVAGLMAPDGSRTATFVGGDVLGITASSKHATQAWDFVSWTLGEQAQVELVAKYGDLPARTDLAGNPYSSKDPRVKATVEGLANGYTPAVLPYGELINNSNGPWLVALREGIFGGDPAKALQQAQSQIQSKVDASS
ncbi:ABC transporter substrate-binding protein [Micromonospora sp. NPDC048930]|uniref:ABC transporter substrate-binding protein n=1 Tax=Micromonospora sp. NPDC048930 TaxID=3364261 RepID=UPI00371FC0A3